MRNVFLLQTQKRCVTNLKSGARLKGNGREWDRLKKTVDRETEVINQYLEDN